MLKKNSKNSRSNRGCDGCFLKGVRSSPKTEFKKGQHWRPDQAFRHKPYLEREYAQKGRSALDIAKEHRVTENAILYWLQKLRIHRRTTSEIRKTKHWGARGTANPMYGVCGPRNPHWIDGSTPERQKQYAHCFWKELIRSVYARDNYKCQRCGAEHKGKTKLHGHHLKPWAGNPNGRLALSNVITLCQDCHRWVHSKENKNREYLLSR